jgi:hypothetical protein
MINLSYVALHQRSPAPMPYSAETAMKDSFLSPRDWTESFMARQSGNGDRGVVDDEGGLFGEVLRANEFQGDGLSGVGGQVE